jgi:tape measure domain-containing protein
MASEYRYNVVVDVSINPQTNQGKTQVRGALNQIEQEAKRSRQNIERDHARSTTVLKNQEKELTDYHARLSASRRQTAIENFRAQENAHKKMITDAVALENSKNQRIAASNRNFHQQRFRDMQAAGQREEALMKLQMARQKKLMHDVQMGSQGLIYSPGQIRNQTASQASGQTRLSNFATSQINGGLADIDSILKGQKIADANRQVDALTKTTAKSTNALGMWGQAFKGAFIGAVAGITFSTIISGITGIARALGQAAVASVQFAADFEQTTNALKVFTGSTKLAQTELAAVGEVVKSVPGLRLQDAEVGYQRLRALGFEAKIAKGFIKELGEEKLLSGANDEAVERVIFNFAQIASGGQKISQELREIVTQMPTLKKVFQDAFGSINYGELQKLIDSNPDKFFQDLIDTMAQGDSVTGGFHSGITDLTNVLTQAGREFGKPLLQPLTDSIRDITTLIDANKNVWAEWGQSVGDSIQGVSDIMRALSESGAFRALVGNNTNGQTALADGLFGFSSIQGRRTRERREEINRPFGGKFIGGDATILKSDAEREAEIAESNAQNKADRIAENARKRELTLLKESGQSRIAILKDQSSVELALAESADALTLDQIMRKNKRISDIEQNHIKQEIARQSDYFNQVIALTTDTDEQAKLTLERNEKISGLNTQLRISEIEEAKQTRDDLRQILEQRRQDAIQFNQLEVRTVQQNIEKQNFALEQGLAQGTIKYEEYYQRQIEISNSNLAGLTKLNKDNLALQLQDEKLSLEARNNLIKESALEEQQLIQDNQQRIFQIEQQLLEQRKSLIRDYVGFIQSTISSASSVIENFTGLLFGQGATSGRSNQAIDFILGAGKTELKEIQNTIKNIYANQNLGSAMSDPQKNVLSDLEARSNSLRTSLERLEPLFDKVKEIYKGFDPSAQGVDRLERDLLIQRQRGDVQSINTQIEAQERIVNLTTEQVAREKELQVLINLKQQRDALGIQNLREQEEQYRKSIDGLKEYNKALADGDALATAFAQNKAIKSRLEDEGALMERIIAQQDYLQNGGVNEALRSQSEILEHIIDLRFKEYEIFTRSSKAQIDISQQLVFSQNEANARVLEFLAQQKGVTDIVSDAKINLLTSAYSGLDSVVGRLTQKFGIFSDAIRETITSLIKLALNPFLRRLFGGGAGGSAAIPGIPGLGGGGGFGQFGTPPFVSNFGSFGSSGGNFSGGSTGGALNSELLHAGLSQGSSGTVGGTGRASFSGILSSLAPVLGGGLGSALGGGSGLGGILGGVGGLAGGALVSALLSGSLTGATTGGIFAGGGLLGLSAVGGITLAAAPLLLLGAYFLGRNKARRRDETTRNQAMIDALKGLDDILSGVKSDRIDGQSALQQADQIRATYVENMSQLKDKKTRRIALADVSRLDSKISEIKAAVSAQESRKARLELSVPTFASGGSLGRYTNSNHVYNPQGYQSGGQAFGYFPSSGTTASFNERGSEYILDAETTRNVGVPELDKMRASRGKYVPAKYMGGLPGNSGGGGAQAPVIENHFVINQTDSGITVEMVKSIVRNATGSEENTANFVNNLVKKGGQPLNTLARSIENANKK